MLAAAGGGGGGGSAATGDPVTLALVGDASLEGSVYASGATFRGSDLHVGDSKVGTLGPVRGFVSFALADVPAGAEIRSARLVVHQRHVANDPYVLGGLLLDHVVHGSVLEAGAYARSPLASGFTVLSASAALGPCTADVTAQVRADLAGRRDPTQYRLRFPAETDGDLDADPSILDGTGSTHPAAQRPVLVVTYVR